MSKPTYEELTQRVKALEKEKQEQKSGDEKLKKQNGFLNLVLESLSHPFYVVNADDYTIQLANSAAQAKGISGKSSTCYALSHRRESPCNSKKHPCPLEIIKQTKEPVTVEHIHYDIHGNRRGAKSADQKPSGFTGKDQNIERDAAHLCFLQKNTR